MAKTAPRLRPIEGALTSRRTPHRLQRLTRLKLIFTLVLAVPFILQVSLAIGLTSWLLLKSRQQAVEDITSRFVSEISNQVYDRLGDFLETPHTVNQINADAVRLGQFDTNNVRKIELRFWRQIQVYDSLTSIGFGRKDGTFVAGDRRNSSFRSGHRDSRSPEGRIHIYYTDKDGNYLGLAHRSDPNYDSRLRPWYQAGAEAVQGRWTDIFAYSSQPIYVLSAVQAFYDQSGTFQGVAVTDLMLSHISDFLRSLDIGESGEVFIVERSGTLVATSTPDAPYEVVNDKARRLQATESYSKLIRTTAQSMQQEFGFSTIDTSSQEDFTLDNKRYFWQVLPYKDNRGLDWLIVVVLPESDLAVNASYIRSAIALALAAFVLSLLVGWLILRSFVRPIANLAATATDVASGSGKKTGSVSRLDDLGAVTMAFNRMSRQLQSSLHMLEDQKAKLAEAQQLAQLGSWDYDVDRDEFSCSDELYRIFGLEPDTGHIAPLTIAQLYQRIHLEDRPRVNTLVRQAVRDRIPVEMDYRILQPSGGFRYLYSKGRPIADESGRVVRMIGTMMDITARKSAKAALEAKAQELSTANDLLTQAKLHLERRNQDLDRFTYAVSHDLKAPLRAIDQLSTWIEEDLDGQLPADNKAQLRLLRQRVARMKALINGLLDFSRVGRSNVVVEAVDLNRLLAEVIDSLAPPKTFTVQVPPDLPIINARRLSLQQVFANLISNAIKHSDRPDGIITITFAEQSEQYNFSVADNGPGIAAEHHERIFSIFETLKSRDSVENTGIGLTLVKKIVETEGGKITVESNLGHGATFRFTWPKLA